MSLEERSHLTEVEKDDYFFHGLKPKSFCTDMKDELRAQELWMDLTSPPRMEHVVTIVKALLRHNLYYNCYSRFPLRAPSVNLGPSVTSVLSVETCQRGVLKLIFWLGN